MITIGSIKRETAQVDFPFLAKKFKGRRKELKNFTPLNPDFVFWIFPDGNLFDAKDAHRKNYPTGYKHILDDEPDYGGFLRGRIASNYGPQLIIVYCRSEALIEKGEKLQQLLEGMSEIPIPILGDTLVISDNGDIYGTLDDLCKRQEYVLF